MNWTVIFPIRNSLEDRIPELLLYIVLALVICFLLILICYCYQVRIRPLWKFQFFGARKKLKLSWDPKKSQKSKISRTKIHTHHSSITRKVTCMDKHRFIFSYHVNQMHEIWNNSKMLLEVHSMKFSSIKIFELLPRKSAPV